MKWSVKSGDPLGFMTNVFVQVDTTHCCNGDEHGGCVSPHAQQSRDALRFDDGSDGSRTKDSAQFSNCTDESNSAWNQMASIGDDDSDEDSVEGSSIFDLDGNTSSLNNCCCLEFELTCNYSSI